MPWYSSAACYFVLLLLLTICIMTHSFENKGVVIGGIVCMLSVYQDDGNAIATLKEKMPRFLKKSMLRKISDIPLCVESGMSRAGQSL